jgi:membrane protein DedA with SNARE-associated domain
MTDEVLSFIRSHEVWAAPVVLLLAFAESFVFLSLAVPATVILFGVGGLIGASGIAFWPVWCAAVAGAVVGDWGSYWLGRHFRGAIARLWPLSRHPGMRARAEAFFAVWGVAGVFLGRFFGPLRSVVPLVAGASAMPQAAFQLANIASAVVWATGILAPGVIGIRWLL